MHNNSISNFQSIQALSIKPHSQVFLLQEDSAGSFLIMKRFSSLQFDFRKYYRLSHLSDISILRPCFHKLSFSHVCVYYPSTQTLLQQFKEKGFSFSQLLSLGASLCQICDDLLSHHWYELDLHPGNLYMDSSSQFLLGDFHFAYGRRPQQTAQFQSPEYLQLCQKRIDKTGPWQRSYVYTICKLLSSFSHLISSSDPSIQNRLEHILQKGLSRNAEDRFGDLLTVKQQLLNLRSCLPEQDSQCQPIFSQAVLSQLFYIKTEPIEKESCEPQIKRRSAYPLVWCLSGILLLLLIYGAFFHHDTSNPLPVSSVQSPTISADTSDQNSSPTAITSTVSSRVEELYLYKKKLTRLNNVSDYPSLRILVASSNQLVDLHPLSNCPALEFLDVSQNRDISDLSPLDSCAHLTMLNLTGTSCSKKEILSFQQTHPSCQVISDYFEIDDLIYHNE